MRTFLLAAILMCSCAPDKKPQQQPSNSEEPQNKIPEVAKDDRWQHVVSELWNSQLGRMLRLYLSHPGIVTEGETQDLTEHIFSDPDLILVRITAAQALVEDVYQHSGLAPEALARLKLLEIDLERKALSIAKAPESSTMAALPVLIALSLICGSPLIQREVKNLGQSVYSATRDYIRWGDIHDLSRIGRDVKWRELFGPKFFENYTPISAALSFASIVPVGLSGFYYWYSRNPELVGRKPKDKLLPFEGKDEFLHSL